MSTKQVTATAKYIRQSPLKVRVLTNLIKGFTVDEAMAKLKLSVKRAAIPLNKVLFSAVSNAVNNAGLNKETLRIKALQVLPGPTLRRPKFRAKGRRDIMRKRSCHIRVVLEGEE